MVLPPRWYAHPNLGPPRLGVIPQSMRPADTGMDYSSSIMLKRLAIVAVGTLLRPEWVIVYVSGMYAIIAWFTLRSIKRQADIMEKQAKDASAAAEVASALATKTLEAIRRQGVSMRRQTTVLRRSARASSKAAEAALKQANHMLASQRPWIYVSVDEQRSTSGRADFSAINRGHSPAKIIMYMAEKVEVSPDGTSNGPKYYSDGRFDEAQWRFPGDEFIIQKFPFGPELAAEVQRTRNFILLQGFVRYEDTLTEDIHETHFCYQVFMENTGMRMRVFRAKGYNTMT
jgi:hypothetical protein